MCVEGYIDSVVINYFRSPSLTNGLLIISLFSLLTVTDHGEARDHYHGTSTLSGSSRRVRGHFMDTCLEEDEEGRWSSRGPVQISRRGS